MGRIERSYREAVKSIRLAAGGKIPEPRNPVLTLTSKGFLFGEENRKNACPVTENLNRQEDWEVADLGEILGRLCVEYISHGEKTQDDWDAAMKLVQEGGSFGLLLPWAKPPKRPKVKAQPLEGPSCDFRDTWRSMAAQRCKVKSWEALPKSELAKYDAAGVIAWRLLGRLPGDDGELAKAVWELWMRMPAVPKR